MALRKYLPRVQLRLEDNRNGAYPTIARTGDRDRLGNHKIWFDDTNTVIFSTNTTVSYPTTLPLGAPIYGPYDRRQILGAGSDLTSSITTTGIVAKDINQFAYISRQVESIGPFREVGLFEQDIVGSQFFATGSRYDEVGNGFANPISAKTIVTIEIPINTAGTLNTLSASISYINTTIGKVEEIAPEERTAPYVDGANAFHDAKLFGPFGNNILSGNISFLTANGGSGSLVGSSLSEALTYTNPVTSILQSPKYAATSSHFIPMANYIAQPFLLEKAIFELPVLTAPDWHADVTYYDNDGGFTRLTAGGPCVTVGLLNCFSDRRDLILSGTIIPDQDNVAQRLLLPFGKAVMKGFLCVGTPSAVISGSAINNSFTGTVRVPAECLISNGVVGSTFANSSRFSDGYISCINPFGRSQTLLPSGRSYFGKEYAMPQDLNLQSNQERIVGPVPNGYTDYPAVFAYEQQAKSPYLLYPQDNLCFFLSKFRKYINGQAIGGAGTQTFTVNTGTLRIRLYGSLVADEKEFHSTLNSRLDTLCVHENIGFDPCLDQFDVEYRSLLTGSYTDNIITGSMPERALIGSNVGTQEPNLHLNLLSEQTKPFWQRRNTPRALSLFDTQEYFYDSFAPGIDDIADVNHGTLAYAPSQGYTLYVHDTVFMVESDNAWTKGFPFSPIYSNFSRKLDTSKLVVKFSYNSGFSQAEPRYFPAELVFLSWLKELSFLAASDQLNSPGGAPVNMKRDDVLKYFFGFGDRNTMYQSGSQLYGTTNLADFYTVSSGLYIAPLIRGWKYGLLSALPTNSKSVFRRDHYGHLRDMLEQRPHTKWFDTANILQSPVQVSFVDSKGQATKPEYTFSSNLSFEATSSLPFFDGEVRNREEPLNLGQVGNYFVT